MPALLAASVVHRTDSEDTASFIRAAVLWAFRASGLWLSCLAASRRDSWPELTLTPTTERWGRPPGPVRGREEAVVTESCPFSCPPTLDHVPVVQARRDAEAPKWNGGDRLEGLEGAERMPGHQLFT